MIAAIFLSLTITWTLMSHVSAECPNACSAHGKCGAYDMCLCYRNWMGNDCSERVCPFGSAHVDTPKGDLDASGGALSGPSSTVITNSFVYPYGTTEQFPAMVDSDGVVLTNSAHYYMECSNKGICDRTTGSCNCFVGYEGSSCQRASCPTNANGMCSGHGTCHSIQELANLDYGNVYDLWDESATMGCKCDPGYYGADCSERTCKYGADPLYYDDYQNSRFANYTVQIFTLSSSAVVAGNYSIIYYDATGEDWETGPIAWNAGCSDVVAALEALPNKVIPSNTVRCYNKGSGYTDNEISQSYSGIYIKNRYILAFMGNPGRTRQIQLNFYLDGKRPTIYSDETTSTLGYHVYPNGYQGEFVDYVNDYCDGVLVSLSTGTSYDLLTTGSTDQTKLLMKCLGGSDGVSTNNIDVYNWDYGTFTNPHLIKLIDSTQDNAQLTTADQIRDSSLYVYPLSNICTPKNADATGHCKAMDPPGFYVALYYEPVSKQFRVLNRPSGDYASTTTFHVYTTKGYLQLVNPNAGAITHFRSMDSKRIAKYTHSNTLFAVNMTNTYSGFYGQMDCINAPVGTYGALDCLNKDDFIVALSSTYTFASSGVAVTAANAHAANPMYFNVYQVKKLYDSELSDNEYPYSRFSKFYRHQLILDYSMNAVYTDIIGSNTYARVYKFNLPSDGGYEYTAQCSNRGLCDSTSGVCQCFHGYTGDNCGSQNALAL